MDNDTERNAELYNPEDERIFDENCLLHGTPHCRLLNMESCNSCYIRNLSEEDQRKAMEDIRMAAAAMPVGGMESLRQDDECAFCRGMKNPADGGYALFDKGCQHRCSGAAAGMQALQAQDTADKLPS